MLKIPAWVKLLAVALAIVAIMWAIYAYGEEQFSRGEVAERARWQVRENEELAAANSTIIMLNRQARDRERQHAEDMALASAYYQEDIRRVELKKDRVIADLRAGTQRLRIPIAASPAACSGITTEAFAAASGRDGAARAELSGSAAEFLVGLAIDADKVVHQLTACQQIIKADRDQQKEE